jgi:hypothetical protein
MNGWCCETRPWGNDATSRFKHGAV